MRATLERAQKAKEMLQGNATPSDPGVSTESKLASADASSEEISTQDTPQDNAVRQQLDRANTAKETFQRKYMTSATYMPTEHEANPELLVDTSVPTQRSAQDGASVEEQATSTKAQSAPGSIPGTDRTDTNQCNVTSNPTSSASYNSNAVSTSQRPINPCQ